MRIRVRLRRLPSELHGLRFHDLRHTAASMLIAQGAHPKVIQELIGHKTIATTLDTYSHALPVPHGQAIRVFRG